MRIILTGLFLIVLTGTHARSDNYTRWEKIPSAQLLEKGSQYIEMYGKPDSALVCYTIVSNRYKKSLDMQEKELSLKAFLNMWYVYFFSYFDYSKSHECLRKAEEIAKDINHFYSNVMLNYGGMYQTLSEQSGDPKYLKNAFYYYRRSVELSIAENEPSTIGMAMVNLISVSSSLGNVQSIKPLLDKYKAFRKKHNSPSPDYNEFFYEGVVQMEKRQFATALHTFELQDSLAEKDSLQPRYHYLAIYNQAMALSRMKRYDEAVGRMKILEKMTAKVDMEDAKLDVFHTFYDIYREEGDTVMSEKYQLKYLLVRDTLLNKQLRFVDEAKKVDEQIAEINHQRRIQQTIIMASVIIVVIVLVFLLIVFYKNRRLKNLNKSLYQKTVDMLRSDELERKRMKALEQQLGEQRKTKEEAKTQNKKYSGSTLSTLDKQTLFADICTAMEAGNGLFSPDFSVSSLAALVSSNTKYVSQVINETVKVNFNTFINEYRIKEACKRLSDTAHYGNLTIEGVANSVGFRSRTAFVVAFKKFVGLTPSEYQRMAKE